MVSRVLFVCIAIAFLATYSTANSLEKEEENETVKKNENEKEKEMEPEVEVPEKKIHHGLASPIADGVAKITRIIDEGIGKAIKAEPEKKIEAIIEIVRDTSNIITSLISEIGGTILSVIPKHHHAAEQSQSQSQAQKES